MGNHSDRSGAWHPTRAIEIAAGTPPGGGLDRTARALLRAMESLGILEVPVRVVNIPGDGARKVWSYVAEHASDPHVVSISSPNLTTDYLAGLARFSHDAFTPLAILYAEYIAFVTRADSPLENGEDLLHRSGRDPGAITVALSTALGNPNHIALARVIRHAGGDVRASRIRVFDSALDAVTDVVAGRADLGVVTAASAVPELRDGRLRALAVSSPARLRAPYDTVPVWAEYGVDCTVSAWRGVTGPSGLAPQHVTFWQQILARTAASRPWQMELERHDWTPMYLDGAGLREYLRRETEETGALFKELGLAP
jgi:putative tricarboxylic transport membrane protein